MKNFCFAVLSVLLVAAQVFGQSSVTASVREYRRANERLLLEDFVRMLSIPNVASDTENIRRNADYLVEQMKRQGLNPQLLQAAEKDAPPAVYGEWNVPNAKRTIVFYAHYDGQPTDPRAWTESAP
jgi:acetylornithine deacetylase/succinyl-diaminopimelate desuccinylase-like protein